MSYEAFVIFHSKKFNHYFFVFFFSFATTFSFPILLSIHHHNLLQSRSSHYGSIHPNRKPQPKAEQFFPLHSIETGSKTSVSSSIQHDNHDKFVVFEQVIRYLHIVFERVLLWRVSWLIIFQLIIYIYRNTANLQKKFMRLKF